MRDPDGRDLGLCDPGLHDPGRRGKVLLACAGLLAVGMVAGGYLLGDGLKRAKAADRSVTVRGLAERNVTADLATWSISYAATGFDLPAVRAEIDANTRELKSYFTSLGFRPETLATTGAGVNQYINNGVNMITITQRMLLRTTDIARAQRAVAQQFDLVRRGVTLQEGSGMRYSFTRLNDIKPAMVAAATRDARRSRTVRPGQRRQRGRDQEHHPGLFLDRSARWRSRRGGGHSLQEGTRGHHRRLLPELGRLSGRR